MNHDNEPDSWVEAAKIRKTLKFVNLFRHGRMTTDQVKRMGDDEWGLVARMLNEARPNQIHRTTIIQILHDSLSLTTLEVPAAMARSIVGDIKTKMERADMKAARDLAKQLKKSLE